MQPVTSPPSLDGGQSTPPDHGELIERRFAEIAPPLTPDAALLEANKCLFCYDAPCTRACPTHIDVPAFIKKIASGNLRGSARVILDANPMGHSCARACPVEVLCEGACVLNDRDEEPIKIALLQRHATDYALAKNLRLFTPGPATGRRVAIVGAGPAGLSCAQDLRRFGHAVTIFDARPLPGGLNTYAIAEYKMRPATALAEAKMVLDLGVDLRTGVLVGRDVPFETLAREYDAVFIAVGLGAMRRLGVDGEDLPGVVDALAFIEALKMRPKHEVAVGRRVVVVGAGNTAIDAATQAKRLGAERVTIVYRRGESEMPAYRYEYELAKRDGCEFRFWTKPVKIRVEGRGLRVECVHTAMSGGGLADVPGSTHAIDCDMVIKALGQTVRSDFAKSAGLRVAENGAMISENPRVLVGGDCGSGGGEIVNAAAEGKQAAARIHELLGFRVQGSAGSMPAGTP